MTDATNNALEILIQERDRINQAIEILQGQTAVPTGRRKAASAPAAKEAKPAKKKRTRNMSNEARKAVSERMKKYWAERRKEKKAAK